MDNSFQNQLGSDTLDSLQVIAFTNDTAYKPYCRVEYGNDWKIELPDVIRSFEISKMVLDPAKDPPCQIVFGERFCDKPIINVTLNSQQVQILNDYNHLQTLYIHK